MGKICSSPTELYLILVVLVLLPVLLGSWLVSTIYTLPTFIFLGWWWVSAFFAHHIWLLAVS
eukprot:COSAG05_NODE_2635_length_2817_cov_1.632082_5_plen_62_part_00